jgi:hypothetical protein
VSGVGTAASLSATVRRAGKAAAGHTRGAEWGIVDSRHGGAGTVPEVSSLSDLSPAFSAIQWQQPVTVEFRASARNALFSWSAARHGPPRLHENHAEVFVSDYSYRSATMGSIFAARRAGT